MNPPVEVDVLVVGFGAAGAAGSIWGHLTEHGGGLTDAIVFGRIAGAEASRATQLTTAGAAGVRDDD